MVKNDTNNYFMHDIFGGVMEELTKFMHDN